MLDGEVKAVRSAALTRMSKSQPDIFVMATSKFNNNMGSILPIGVASFGEGGRSSFLC